LLKKRLEGTRVNPLPAEVPSTFFDPVTQPAPNGRRLFESTVEVDDGWVAKMRILMKGADTLVIVTPTPTCFGSGL